MAKWRIERSTVALTVDLDAYTANDVVGGLITLPLGGGYTGGGFINRIMLVDNDNEKAAMHLYLFDQSPTAILNDAAFEPLEAEATYQIGEIAIPAGNYTSYTSDAYAIARASGKDATDGEFISWEYAPSGSIYAYLVCDATPTYTATTDLTLIVEMWTS